MKIDPKRIRMVRNMTPDRFVHAVVVLALALASSACNASLSPKPDSEMSGMMAKMKEGCQALKDKKEKMKEDMKADDAELTSQLALMNHATGEKRADLMAAVVTRMEEQRIAMSARKAEMEEEMMKHMMMHMSMGKDSASKCPMMQEMKDMKKTAGSGPAIKVGFLLSDRGRAS